MGDGEKRTADCPKCHSAMRTVAAGSVEVDRCDRCRGLWFDMLELDKLVKDRASAEAVDRPAGPAAPAAKGPMLCPRDRSTLIRMAALGQPHVQYESCKVCGGAFLDAGELRDLSEVTLRERVRRFFA